MSLVRLPSANERFKYRRLHGREWHWSVPGVLNVDCKQRTTLTKQQWDDYQKVILVAKPEPPK